MKRITRREAITAMAAGGAAIVGADSVYAKGGNETMSEEQTVAQSARAFRGQHQPKPLPFDPARLKGLSERLIRSHWENNYGGAVRALNSIEQKLDSMLKDKDLPAYIYGDLKREELARTGSVVLHEHYFSNLGGDGKSGGKALDLIKQWFDSYETWETEFKKTANALAGGSGWAIMAYNLHTGELHNYWAWDHMHNAPMSRPLLVLDMYEHSYHMDYGAAAARYVDAFMQNINWEEVSRRTEAALKASLA
jgi:Fe-Mn family superoxide dismutase